MGALLAQLEAVFANRMTPEKGPMLFWWGWLTSLFSWPESKQRPRRQAVVRTQCKWRPLELCPAVAGCRVPQTAVYCRFTTSALNCPPCVKELPANDPHIQAGTEQVLKPEEGNDITGKARLYTERRFWWLCQYLKKKKQNWFTLDWEGRGRLLL